jgi:glycerol uptake facilitator-like aquaporin
VSLCLIACGCLCVLMAHEEPVVAHRWRWAAVAVAWGLLAVAVEVAKRGN